jgi:hypothetical protein
MQAKDFKKPSAKKSYGTAQPEQEPAENNARDANRKLFLKGHPLKLGLVHHPKCEKCKQASDTASHILCDCEALAT